MANRSVRAQWTNAVMFALAAVALFFLNGRSGLGGLIVPLILLGIAVTSTPLFKRESVSRSAALASDSEVVIYHRPGCTFCIRMKAMLGKDGAQVTWVDIWDDEEAAAFVRSVNDGNETVPTVVVGGKAHTNPEPAFVRDQLAA